VGESREDVQEVFLMAWHDDDPDPTWREAIVIMIIRRA
jgi:hypothetical protein